MSVRTVPLTLPEHIWGRLASVADSRGVKIADLLAEAVGGVVAHPHGKPKPILLPPVEDRLKVLNAELSAARRDGWRAPNRSKKGVAK